MTSPPATLSGMTPGVLDPSQPSRILRNPASQLHFASFHPHTASPDRELLNLQSLSLKEELYRPKRVVIEITPEGSFWRFVPRARREDGVCDESLWPKLVDVCGQIVICSQDQWDIYMLDSAYTCLFRAPPHLPTIMRSEAFSPEYTRPTAFESFKRHLFTSSPDHPMKKPRTTQTGHANFEGIVEDQEMADLSPEDSLPITKRKERGDYPDTGTDCENRRSRQENSHPNKRIRMRSPASIRRELMGRRAERGRQRARERKQKMDQYRRARDEAFERELYGDYPEQRPNENSDEQHPNQQSQTNSNQEEDIDPEEVARRKIEESRRKIAELEKDKPLWEEEARKRRLREEAEERSRKAAKEAREAKRLEKERREREARERAERERIQREEAVRKAKERKRAQNRARWACGPWSVQRALERYRSLCDQFDDTKFDQNNPLAFADVPWPMLAVSFSVEDIDWSAVEQFFESVKPYMRIQDYRVFVEKSHRRFHPDRWRARGLLKSIPDDEDRECMEVAANTVAQALTPLWRQAKR